MSQPEIPRRDFMRLTAVALATPFAGAPAFAGPFDDKLFPIPPDKKLHPEWVKSLFSPGSPTRYRKSRDELKFIGMPVGGLFCGTLYFGGDGRLWLWDIFNDNRLGVRPGAIEWSGGTWQGRKRITAQDGANYVDPPLAQTDSPVAFSISSGGDRWHLDGRDWAEVEFTGQYPVGNVSYSDPARSVSVKTTAFSPFIPLDLEDSSLPATILEFEVTNRSEHPIDVTIEGHFESWCGRSDPRIHQTEILAEKGAIHAGCGVKRADRAGRKDISIDDFNRESWAPWTSEGKAFGSGPLSRDKVPSYQGDLGGPGTHVVNSHASAPGDSIAAKDAQTGRLTSPGFTIERDYINFWIGGGADEAHLYAAVEVDGKIVAKATGHNSNQMREASLAVGTYTGKSARIVIVDEATGPWGNIGVAHIRQSDHPAGATEPEAARDFGSMSLVGLDGAVRNGSTVSTPVHLRPGESTTLRYVVAWYFPNAKLNVADSKSGRHYKARFSSSAAVAHYVRDHYDRLAGQTKAWVRTWYGSTLPQWFLERTIANTCILATTTAHRFATGRFWAWEGIGCCEGTCTHVWHYAQAPGRLFPALERDHRERVDFGVGFDSRTGIVRHRGEGTGPAIDGECGRILGVLREHQMSPDDRFLRRIWPNVRRATEYLIGHDSDGDGLIDGAQENTLDAAWFGKIAWISSLYLAALRASEKMATIVGDSDFATRCATHAAQTARALETELYDGEYFIQKPEPGREQSLGTYRSCHIDQVHGQSWAWQVGLGRILDREKALSALRSLYRYNFAPDVGPFRKANPEGRPYALAGDGGLVMATNPKGLEAPFGNAKDWQFGYFNECMSGFEHQAASHMIAEGMVLEGLAVTRAIHDRYHAKRRNPYNEVECSDHYSRAMASYGSFVSACGFHHDGPAGFLSFDPKIRPENFRAAFVTCEGWGTYSQKKVGDRWVVSIEVKFGTLRLERMRLSFPTSRGDVEDARFDVATKTVAWNHPLNLVAGQSRSWTFT